MTGKSKENDKVNGESSPHEKEKNSNESFNDHGNMVIEEKDQSDVKTLNGLSNSELVEKIKALEEELELNTKKIENSKDWKEKYMLLQAEFENAQKRWNKDKTNLRLEHVVSVLRKFLPLYDSYKKATDNDPNNESIKQFYNQFLNIIKAHDGAEVMKVKVNEPFDYHYHEALSSIERDDLPNNTIIDIIQDGWMIGKDVLRYAKVVTSRKPKPIEPEKKEEESKETIKLDNSEEEKSDSIEAESEKNL